MNCPLCVDPVLEVTHHSGVELDICPQCRGVWLDRGELERIAGDRSATPSTPPPSRDDDWRGSAGHGDAHDGRPRKNRKRRFAERLGDVFEEVLDL